MILLFLKKCYSFEANDANDILSLIFCLKEEKFHKRLSFIHLKNAFQGYFKIFSKFIFYLKLFFIILIFRVFLNRLGEVLQNTYIPRNFRKDKTLNW